MLIRSEGYSHGYSHERVAEYARGVVERLQALFEETGATAVVVHGNSGVSIGFAALSMKDFPLVLVRKDNDNSHGSPIEAVDGLTLDRYIILDDFVASGATVRRIIEKIDTLHNARYNNDGIRPECVGVLCYTYDDDECGHVEGVHDGQYINLYGI